VAQVCTNVTLRKRERELETESVLWLAMFHKLNSLLIQRSDFPSLSALQLAVSCYLEYVQVAHLLVFINQSSLYTHFDWLLTVYFVYVVALMVLLWMLYVHVYFH